MNSPHVAYRGYDKPGVFLERVRRDVNEVAHADHDTTTFAEEL